MKYRNPNDKPRKRKSKPKYKLNLAKKLNTIERKVKSIESADERKYYYAFADTPSLIAGQSSGTPTSYELLGHIIQGGSSSQRIGDRIRLKHIDIRTFYDWYLVTPSGSNGSSQTWVRQIIFVDNQADAPTAPGAEQVLRLASDTPGNMNVISQVNHLFDKRITILDDQIFQLGLGSYDTYATLAALGSGFRYGNMGTSPFKIIDYRKSFNTNIVYKASTGADSDMVNKAIYVWAFDEQGKNVRMSIGFTVSYTDN